MYNTIVWCIGFSCALTYGFKYRAQTGSDTSCFKNLRKRSQNYHTVSISNTTSYHLGICRSNSDKLHIIEDLSPDKTKFTYRDLYICWPKHLRQGTLIFNGGIVESRPKSTVSSQCSHLDSISQYKNVHTTVIYVLLRMYPVTELKVYYTPNVRYFTVQPKTSMQTYKEKISERPKRQTMTNYTQISTLITDSSECGKSRGCFRDGDSRCQHFGCDYFFSYWTDNIVVDIELSGKSSGWVAIGFSSDRKMIGDDIFACIYKDNVGGPIRAVSYEDPHQHIRPEERQHYTVKHSETKNGFMYCRFEVPVKRDYSDVDLTNEWIQFYAHGSVLAGLMEKHSESPLMSKSLISIVQRIDVVNKASTLMPFPMVYLILIKIL